MRLPSADVSENDHTDAYPRGIKLGVDVGTVRVGVAACDPEGILATPFKTVARDAKKNSDIRLIVRHAKELGAVQIFVGLPRTMRGEEHASARMATEYAGLLAAELDASGVDVPVHLVDERLSTVTAHRSLHEAGMSSRDHRKVVDQVAAAGILQHAIDMQKARGADVGSRVTAIHKGHPGGSGADSARTGVQGTDTNTSTRGSQQ
jgi:putative Holliday junction resolvase